MCNWSSLIALVSPNVKTLLENSNVNSSRSLLCSLLHRINFTSSKILLGNRYGRGGLGRPPRSRSRFVKNRGGLPNPDLSKNRGGLPDLDLIFVEILSPSRYLAHSWFSYVLYILLSTVINHVNEIFLIYLTTFALTNS